MRPAVVLALTVMSVASAAPQLNHSVDAVYTPFTRVYQYPLTYDQNPYVDFTKYVSDLSVYPNMNNAISAACVNGLWLYYNDINYNKNVAEHGVTWLHGIQYCSDITTQMDNKISSFRYGGSSSYINQPSFTVYDGQGFQGDEFYSDNNAAHFSVLSGKASSVIITGPSSWTFYSYEGYTGQSVCLTPTTVDTKNGAKLNLGLWATIPQFYDNTFRSAREGCYSNLVLSTEPLGVFNQSANGAAGYISF